MCSAFTFGGGRPDPNAPPIPAPLFGPRPHHCCGGGIASSTSGVGNLVILAQSETVCTGGRIGRVYRDLVGAARIPAGSNSLPPPIGALRSSTQFDSFGDTFQRGNYLAFNESRLIKHEGVAGWASTYWANQRDQTNSCDPLLAKFNGIHSSHQWPLWLKSDVAFWRRQEIE
jgi:hypothetical protein